MSIEFKNVSYIYGMGSPTQVEVLKDINLKIADGTYTTVIGHTGSGKSTLVKHLNGLNRPTSGTVQVDNEIFDGQTKSSKLNGLRKVVGFVFQQPENQLFETTVLKDVSFGPHNFGFSEEESQEMAIQALKIVNIPENLFEVSPFDLSGGQQRRVAIAGVLAVNPKILVLDEPTAGLDPEGSNEIMNMFKRIQMEQEITIVSVTHQMDDVAKYADRVIVMEDGKLIGDFTPEKLFNSVDFVKNHHLGFPQPTEFALQLQETGKFSFNQLPIRKDQLVVAIKKHLQGVDYE